MERKIREAFIELNEQCRSKNAEDRYALIAYLQSLLAGGKVSHFEDIGFCYWNISDQYALLRDGHHQMQNHQRFYEHVKQGKPHHLYWLLCDATQRLTLEKDGYGEAWWSWYREAVKANVTKGLPVEFAAHKAALYKNPLVKQDENRVEFAKGCFEEFLSCAKGQKEYAFYYTVYLSLLAQYESVDALTLYALGTKLLVGLSASKSADDFLIGEWEKYVTPLDERRRAEIGLNSVINALINTQHLDRAKCLYTDAVAAGMPRNGYIESRI